MELVRLQKQIDLLDKAYKTLEIVFLENKKLNDLEKDGVIQRFEYNIELLHKTLKKVLEYLKVDFTPSPRDIIRESFKLGFVDDLELLDEFLDIRNQMSHIYSQYYSNDNFEFIKLHYKEIFNIIKKLKSKFEK